VKKAQESFHISQPLSSSATPFTLIKKTIHSDGTMPYYIKFNHHQQSHILQQLTPATAKKEEELGIRPSFAVVVVPLLWVPRSPNRLRNERQSKEREKLCLISETLGKASLAQITIQMTEKTGCPNSTQRKLC